MRSLRWKLFVAGFCVAAVAVVALRWPRSPEPSRRPSRPVPEAREKPPEPERRAPRGEEPGRKDPAPMSPYDRVLAALRAGDREAILRLLAELSAEIAPGPVPDDENAATLYNEAFEKISTPTEEEQRAIDALRSGAATPAQLALVRAYLDRNHDALRLLREAADRPRCNFNLDYSQGLAMEMPHIAKMIRAEKLLQIEGMFEGTPEVIRAAHRLSQALLDGPVLISQLVRMVNTGITAYTLGEALDDALARLDVEHYVRSMQSYEALAARPYHEVREELERLEREAVDGAPQGSVYGRNLFPAMARAARNQAASEANVAIMRIATAARIFHATRGYYPVSLDELRSVLPDPPTDPLTGRPFDYRLEGTGFVVSSADEESHVSLRVRR
jgi:hypothetical protein